MTTSSHLPLHSPPLGHFSRSISVNLATESPHYTQDNTIPQLKDFEDYGALKLLIATTKTKFSSTPD